jgi:septum formation protein
MHADIRLILASISPYRRQLLQRLGMPFEVCAPEYEEKADRAASPEELVRRHTLGKLQSVADRFPAAWVIASDQLAECDGEIMGKPGGRDAAIGQLSRMSGKSVRFLTGLAFSRAGSVSYELVPYWVHMRELDAGEIIRYVEREQPYDCAGSFKSEGLGVALFRAMEGDDPTSLIGLPLIHLSRMLQPLQPIKAC